MCGAGNGNIRECAAAPECFHVINWTWNSPVCFLHEMLDSIVEYVVWRNIIMVWLFFIYFYHHFSELIPVFATLHFKKEAVHKVRRWRLATPRVRHSQGSPLPGSPIIFGIQTFSPYPFSRILTRLAFHENEKLSMCFDRSWTDENHSGDLVITGSPHIRPDPVTAIVFALKSSAMFSCLYVFDEKNHYSIE